MLARGPDRRAHHLSDRLHHLPAGDFSFPQVWRRYLRGRYARRAGAARNRRAAGGHHGGGAIGQRLHRRTRLDENARGNRRAAHHGFRSDRGPGAAEDDGADHRAADPGLSRGDCRAVWRRAGGVALWRRRSRGVPAAPARRDLDRSFHRRHHQGACDGGGDRDRRLRRGACGRGQRRIARAAHHVLGGEGDLLRHRDGRRIRDLLRLDWNVTMAPEISDAIIRVRDISVHFGATKVLDGLNLDVKRGEILGFVGPSGAGKSVLTRTIIGLVPKVSGRIEVFGIDLDAADAAARRGVERRWGILFQQGALFSSLTVRQNIQFPVREYLNVSQRLLDEITVAKLGMVGLRPEVADRFPSELSGGMIKRVALARALALDPELVFLDEPTSGLDPIGAGDFDELVRTLQRTLGLTVFMVTHDLDSLYTACDRIAVLGNGKIIAAGSMADMQASQHPWLRAYFHGNRIGEVISVKLDNPRRVVALAMVENNAPIRKDTLVGLEFQGLTGVAAIALKGGEEAAPPVPLDEDGVPVLTADPNALQDVTEAIRATLQNVNRIVADNQESVKNSLHNLETFTSALARNSEKIDSVMLKVDGVMGKADSLMLGLNTIAGGNAGGELSLMVKSIRELADDFDKRSGALMADGRRTLGDISRAVNNLDRNPTRLLFGAGNSNAAPAEAPKPAAGERK